MQLLLTNPELFALFILILASTLLSLYTLIAMRKLSKLKEVFFSGTQAADLETVIHNLHAQLGNLADEQSVTAQHVTQLYEQTGLAVQKIGLVRFNPFDDGGGNFSFCLALLDSHNNGVVITSMYGRQQNRIYSKKVTGGNGDTALAEEEKHAINLADSK